MTAGNDDGGEWQDDAGDFLVFRRGGASHENYDGTTTGMDLFGDLFQRNRTLVDRIRAEFREIARLKREIGAVVVLDSEEEADDPDQESTDKEDNDHRYGVEADNTYGTIANDGRASSPALPAAPLLHARRITSLSAQGKSAATRGDVDGNDTADEDAENENEEEEEKQFHDLEYVEQGTDTFGDVISDAYEEMREAGEANALDSVYVRKSIAINLPPSATRKGSLMHTQVHTGNSPKPPTPVQPPPALSPQPSKTLVTPAVQKRQFRGSVWTRREFAGWLYKKPRSTSLRSVLGMKWQRRWFEISTHYLRYHMSPEDKNVKGAIDLHQIRGVEAVSSKQGVHSTFALQFKGTRKMLLRVRATERYPNPIHIMRTWCQVVSERLDELTMQGNGASGKSDSQRRLKVGFTEKNILPTLDDLLPRIGEDENEAEGENSANDSDEDQEEERGGGGGGGPGLDLATANLDHHSTRSSFDVGATPSEPAPLPPQGVPPAHPMPPSVHDEQY